MARSHSVLLSLALLLCNFALATAREGRAAPHQVEDLTGLRRDIEHQPIGKPKPHAKRQVQASDTMVDVTVSSSFSCSSSSSDGCSPYWLENLPHQGISPFANNSGSYKVFRNVKDYGAKGKSLIPAPALMRPTDWITSTTTPALVYFPAGTYIVSKSIIDYYYTQLIGDPNCPPLLKATANFTGLGVIDGNKYGEKGLSYKAIGVFLRHIRNFVIDITNIPANATATPTGIHWPTSQGTVIQNVVFQMSKRPGSQQQGIFMEEGSGGFMADLAFYGGRAGAHWGNQQFTMRNLSFYGCETAIDHLWDWGWYYKSIHIEDCGIGINMAAQSPESQNIGSISFVDSEIINTETAFRTSRDEFSQPPTGGSLIIENVNFINVKNIVTGPKESVTLPGSSGTTFIDAWGQGHYLKDGNKYFEYSRPSYAELTVADVISARDYGAKGDGTTDDTSALQRAVIYAVKNNKLLFVDAGSYIVTRTLYFPAGLRITGEAYSVILSNGSYLADIDVPRPVVQIGLPGELGRIEWTDMVVSGQGPQAGAILIEYNLKSPDSHPAGIWDVHTRLGGFTGSRMGLNDCPKAPGTSLTPETENPNCFSAFMNMHITPSAAGLYVENVWLWTADQAIDEGGSDFKINVYTGRGIWIDRVSGPLWLVATGAEHCNKYQYQITGSKDIFIGFGQTESPYFQPWSDANDVWISLPGLDDPVFADQESAWGMRIMNSEVLLYGAGWYSFFNNYDESRCAQPPGGKCQSRIFSIEQDSQVTLYGLNTVGTADMITKDDVPIANFADNQNNFTQTVMFYRSPKDAKIPEADDR
ncbi:exo-beta-1,3-glucanase-like protein [Phyllosticta citrichinensis]|uniref:Exo-beta-1,3-glucanase-like protein n=1 Tax=Phyllosticta citrichinensis TaxID=1130410 RepID=A0ABR1Y1J1_9PEZI